MNLLKCILVLFVLVAAGVRGEEVSSEKLGFKVTFPDSPGWSRPEYQSQGDKIQFWAAANQAAGQALIVTVITVDIPGAKPNFQETAAGWESGVLSRFPRKISSRFASLAGHEAYELVASVKNDQAEIFTTNWMLQVGATTYTVTIVAKESSALAGATQTSFLNSPKITK